MYAAGAVRKCRCYAHLYKIRLEHCYSAICTASHIRLVMGYGDKIDHTLHDALHNIINARQWQCVPGYCSFVHRTLHEGISFLLILLLLLHRSGTKAIAVSHSLVIFSRIDCDICFNLKYLQRWGWWRAVLLITYVPNQIESFEMSSQLIPVEDCVCVWCSKCHIHTRNDILARYTTEASHIYFIFLIYCKMCCKMFHAHTTHTHAHQRQTNRLPFPGAGCFKPIWIV